MKNNVVAESQAGYNEIPDYDYDYEHRFAEHEGKVKERMSNNE